VEGTPDELDEELELELDDELELEDELEFEDELELELDEELELELELGGFWVVSPPQAVRPRAINSTLPQRSDCFFSI
jgi:hypothetical protein